MDIENLRRDCEKCKGTNVCDKACSYRIAESFVYFLTKVDFLNTSIGDFDRTDVESRGPYDLVCTGLQMYEREITNKLLSKSLGYTRRSIGFNNLNDKSPKQLVYWYLSKKNNRLDEEMVKTIKQLIVDLSDFRAVIYPFKVGTRCSVVSSRAGNRVTKLSGEIKSVKWKVSNKSGLMESFVLIHVSEGGKARTIEKNITDYGVEFFMEEAEFHLKFKSSIKDIVELTNDSVVKPIEVRGKHQSLILDNRYLYRDTGSNLEVVTRIDEKNKLKSSKLLESVEGTEEYEVIRANLAYIMLHRSFMAPYGMVATKLIQV